MNQIEDYGCVVSCSTTMQDYNAWSVLDVPVLTCEHFVGYCIPEPLTYPGSKSFPM